MLRFGVSVLVFSCAASTGQTPVGYDFDVDIPGSPNPTTAPAALSPDTVARAAGPVRVLRMPEGTELQPRDLERELLESDSICLGEEHDNATHHYAEAWLVDRLAVEARIRGLELGIGFEMFQQPFQHALSAYQRGDADEGELLSRSEYQHRWGFDFAFYRPILENARERGLSLLALNPPRELTREVARVGIDRLDARRAQDLPTLDFQNAQHRADFERRMQHHPGLNPEKLESYYQAQVIWDEGMAERSAEWLLARAPIRRLLIIAGQAHCQRPAIPARIERRGAGRARGMLLTTSEPEVELAKGFDYALVVGIQ